MSAELVVRAATPADFKAVMEMSLDVYEGYDYLPSYYHIYLQSHDCHPFVGQIADEIVGFAMMQITDGGLTVVSVAGRVKASRSGQGIYYLMLNQVTEIMYHRVPTIKYVTHTGLSAKHFDLLEKVTKTGDAPERIILKWNLLLYNDSTEKFRQWEVNTSLPTEDTTELRNSEAAKLFLTASNLLGLFPTGYLVAYQNWRPHRVNYDTILRVVRSHYTICTYRKGSSSKLKALSFSFMCRVPIGVRLDVYYYDVVVDIDVLLQHVYRHLKHASSVTRPGSQFRVMIHFPKHYGVETVKTSLKAFMGDNSVTPYFNRQSALALEGLMLPKKRHEKLKSNL